MQQRQLRLGDTLDDYCPRERRLTNHVVVAMIGDTVKQTRCTTCDSDHEYKHAALPRQRKKPEQSTLYSQVLAGVTPKKVVPPPPSVDHAELLSASPDQAETTGEVESADGPDAFDTLFATPDAASAAGDEVEPVEEGPAHRRLIRAQLPRHEGQVSTTRQAPDFTIRQPNTGRAKRFTGRAPFQGNRQGGGGGGNANGNGNGGFRGGNQRSGGRPQGGGRHGNRHGGRNRSK